MKRYFTFTRKSSARNGRPRTEKWRPSTWPNRKCPRSRPGSCWRTRPFARRCKNRNQFSLSIHFFRSFWSILFTFSFNLADYVHFDRFLPFWSILFTFSFDLADYVHFDRFLPFWSILFTFSFNLADYVHFDRFLPFWSISFTFSFDLADYVHFDRFLPFWSILFILCSCIFFLIYYSLIWNPILFCSVRRTL